MDRWIRRLLERTLADKIAVANAATSSQVQALLKQARPVEAPGGLKRFGPAGDGGYLLPDDLANISACISPGVSDECGFDAAMANLGMDVFMADASVAKPPVDHPRFHFTGKFLDICPSDRTMTMEEMCAGAKAGDLLLQMDIEGAEYRVLTALPDELLRRFRIIVIEFHDLDAMFSRFGFTAMLPVFQKLAQHHRVVHIHPNNCSQPVQRYGIGVPPVMEFTFYRKDRFTDAPTPAVSFPHPLDAPCMPELRDYPLPAAWRGRASSSERI